MPVTLQHFQEPRLRNLLRGAQANTDTRARQKTINNARQLLSSTDAAVFATAMCEGDLDESFYGPAFPEFLNTIYRTPRRKAIPLNTECTLQSARLTYYFDRLEDASSKLGHLNTSILCGDLSRARQQCMEFLSEFGYSATLARKATYIGLLASGQNEKMDNPQHSTQADDLLQLFFSKGSSRLYAQYINLTIDICDRDIDCFETMRDHMQFLKESIATSNRFPPNYAMMRRILFPTNYHSIVNTISLLYFSSSSAIDLLVDLCTASHCAASFPKGLEELFSQPSFRRLRAYLQPSRESLAVFMRLPHIQDPEQAAYRASSIFTEVVELGSWRRAIDFEFYIRDTLPLPTETPANDFFSPHLRLGDLCEAPTNTFHAFSQYDNSASSSFLRTVAVLNCIRKGDRLSTLTADKLRVLLSQTREFSRLLHKSELLELRNHSEKESADVIVFLTMVMLNQKEPNEDLAFEMRMAFQMVVMKSHNSDIIAFLNWLNERTASLCPVVVDLCDISFLERLYLINSSYAEVLANRERMCRWMAETFNLQEYDTIADRLALDAKVRRIRKGIDEARIFVDVLRYKQWALDALAPILRKFERVVSVAPPTLEEVSRPVRKQSTSKEAPVASLDFWFYAASERAFSEFCHNNLFGIDSYLSRRIRHGTLAGTLISPIQRKVSEFQDEHCQPLAPDYRKTKEVLDGYTQIVAVIRDELLHFKTKEKPSGLFIGNAGQTKTRASIQADFRNRLVDFFQEGYTATELSPLFLDHCWDLLTEDLYRIQDELRTIFTAKVRPLLRSISDGKSETAWKLLATDLDQTAERLFNNLLRWFGKSEGSAMTVGVKELVTVVVQEVARYFPAYRQKYQFVSGGDESISGLTYQTVYDLFSVFFTNIAQHGDPAEEARLWSEFVDLEASGSAMLKIRIVSKILKSASDAQVRGSIADALDNNSHEDSMVREGKSGLGKVQAIIRGYSEKGQFSWQVEDGWCDMEFRIPVIVVRS